MDVRATFANGGAMRSDGRRDASPAPEFARGVTAPASADSQPESEPPAADTSREQLRAAFETAAAVADRAIGPWLARSPSWSPPVGLQQRESSNSPPTLGALRAVVRAATTAYARRLRDDGVSPERMLVLVKSAAASHGSPRFGSQELTNEIVRWSIQAYFDD